MADEQLLERVTDLEIRLTHQEAAIDELTQTALRQQGLLERIVDELDQIKAVIKEMSPRVTVPLSEETPPPHY